MLFAADLCIRDDFGKILAVRPRRERRDDFFNILLGQLIVVRDFDKLVGGVDEEHVIGRLGMLQNHDAGGNGRPEKEVCRQLDDAIDLIVINEIFADLLFRAAAVHDTGEANDRRRAVTCQPRERVHDKGKICLRFGRKDARRRIARVVDEERVVAPLPRDGIGRIGDDDFKGLVVPMVGLCERIAVRDVELIGANVVQEHIDTAEVVCRNVDLLPEKPLTDMLLAQDLGGFQKQGPRTAGGVYKNAVFDTNRKSLLRHISAEKGLKQRAFEVPLCFTAEFRKPFFCLFDCCWPVLWPLELTPQNRQSKE